MGKKWKVLIVVLPSDTKAMRRSVQDRVKLIVDRLKRVSLESLSASGAPQTLSDKAEFSFWEPSSTADPFSSSSSSFSSSSSSSSSTSSSRSSVSPQSPDSSMRTDDMEMASERNVEKDHSRWVRFWEQLKTLQANVIIVISPGVCKGNLYLGKNDSEWYSINGELLASEIVDKFNKQQESKEENDMNFQVLILAGVNTSCIGAVVDTKFQRIPLLVPPSIICWDEGLRALKGIAVLDALEQYIGRFLASMLKVRDPDIQKRLDLRGAMHSFIVVRREAAERKRIDPIFQSIQFFPKSELEYIEHIYYRLGLSAFELGRRLDRIINYHLMLSFKQRPVLRMYSLQSTLFLFAEMFAWLYVLRQQPAQLYYADEIRNLEYSFSGEGVPLEKLSIDPSYLPVIRNQVDERFREGWRMQPISKSDHTLFQLLKLPIRAMGEAMVFQDANSYKVLSYQEFKEALATDVSFKSVFEELTGFLSQLEENHNLYLCPSEHSKQASWQVKDKIARVKQHYDEIYDKDKKKNIDDSIRILKEPVRGRLAWIHNSLYLLVHSYTSELLEGTPTISPIFASAEETLEIEIDKEFNKIFPSSSDAASSSSTPSTRSSSTVAARLSRVISRLLSPISLGVALGVVLALLEPKRK